MLLIKGKMKINKKIEETYYKMIFLEIPIEKRRRFIEIVYSFPGRLYLLPIAFKEELNELSKLGIKSKEAVSEIEKMLGRIAIF